MEYSGPEDAENIDAELSYGEAPEIEPEIIAEGFAEQAQSPEYESAEIEVQDDSGEKWQIKAREIAEVRWNSLDKKAKIMMVGGVAVSLTIGAILYARHRVRFKPKGD